MEGKGLLRSGKACSIAAPKIPFYPRNFCRPPHAQGPCHQPRPPNLPATKPALEELEQLVGRIEAGQMPLEQMLQGYQRGRRALLAFCRHRLDAVENQIKVLDEGSCKPWTQE
jgi:exodeoxyribonuclease VII small subunit